MGGSRWRAGRRVACLVAATAGLAGAAPAQAFDVSLGVPGVIQINGTVLGSCDVCASFVTTADLDGSGPLPQQTRRHDGIVANVPYALDVDGALPPLPLGVLPLLPGYELRVTVEGLSADKATVRMDRLAGTPPTLPLRAEIIRPDTTAGTWQSFGYDTLDSSAPQTFAAAIDLTARDADPQTDQVAVGLTIGGAAQGLTLVNERFGGDPAGTRSDRAIARLHFRGDGDETRVPRTASLDLASPADGASDPPRHVLTLTRDDPTVLDFELVEPGGDPRVTGTIDQLPTRTKVDLSDVPLAGDRIQKRLHLDSTSSIREARIDAHSGNRRASATIDDLPADTLVTFTAPPADAPPPRSTVITYKADDRATRARITLARDGDAEGVPATDELTLDVHDVPTEITDLTYTSRDDGAALGYHADGRATSLVADGTLHAGAARRRLHAEIDDLPASIDLTHSTADGTHVDYDADAGATRAAATIDVDPDVRSDVAPLQHVTVDLLGDDSHPLPSTVGVHAVKSGDETTVDYTAGSEIPRVEIHGTNVPGLPAGVRRLDIELERVPTAVRLFSKSTQTDTTRRFIDCSQSNAPVCDPDCDEVNELTCFLTYLETEFPECDQNDLQDDVCPSPILAPTSTERIRASRRDVSFDAFNGHLGSAEVQLSSGPDAPLPATGPPRRDPATGEVVAPPLDGVAVEDIDRPDDSLDRKVTFVRLSELQRVVFGTGTRTRTVRGVTILGDRITATELELVADASDHALAIHRRSQSAGSEELSTSVTELASVPGRVEVELIDHNSDQQVDYEADRPVFGYQRPEGSHAEGFRQLDTTTTGDTTTPVKTVILDPMPRILKVCKVALGDFCAQQRFDDGIRRLRDGDYPIADYRCFGNGCVGLREIPLPPGIARRGSLRLEADPTTNMSYSSGDTEVQLQSLDLFALQASKYEFSCTSEGFPFTCQSGYIGLDTGNDETLVGTITSGTTRFGFPLGFKADRRVWGFHESGLKQGEVGVVGTVECPDTTEIVVSGDNHTRKFCLGHLTEWETIDL